jgi:hypothetical protein
VLFLIAQTFWYDVKRWILIKIFFLSQEKMCYIGVHDFFNVHLELNEQEYLTISKRRCRCCEYKEKLIIPYTGVRSEPKWVIDE